METNTFIKKTAVLISIILIGATASMAQVIKGTIYRDGKPAAGVEVTAHKSKDSFFTSFDGKYEISVNSKSKYLKFTFPDVEEKYSLEGNTKEIIDFYLGGKPTNAGPTENPDANLGCQKELLKAKNKDYMRKLSLYNQFYKQKDYNSALEHWIHIYNKYPKSSENIYIHGLKIYNSFMKQAAPGEKDAFFEKVMEIHDRRIKYFGREGYNKGRKATAYLEYKLDSTKTENELKEVYKTGYTLLNSAVEAEGNKTEAAVLLLLMQTTDLLYKTGEFGSDKILEVYEKTTSIIDSNLEKTPDEKNYKMAKRAVNAIFVTSVAADCNTIEKLYRAKFDADPNNIDLLKKMLGLLNRKNCTDSKLFADGAERLYSLEPTAGAARSMARLFLKKGNIAKTVEYYKEAINRETDNIDKSTYLYELALLKFTQRDLSTARNLAKRSISLNSHMGKSYMLIGKIYASSSKSVSSKEFEQRIVFCLAVDYFIKAKSVDPNLAREANSQIASYRRHFPNKENAFFEGYSNGQIYRIGGWINETTKIRVR